MPNTEKCVKCNSADVVTNEPGIGLLCESCLEKLSDNEYDEEYDEALDWAGVDGARHFERESARLEVGLFA